MTRTLKLLAFLLESELPLYAQVKSINYIHLQLLLFMKLWGNFLYFLIGHIKYSKKLDPKQDTIL